VTPHQHQLAEQALLAQEFDSFWKPLLAQLETGFLTTMVRGFALREAAWVQKNFGSRNPQENDVVSHYERLRDAPKIFWKAFLHALLEGEEAVIYAIHWQQSHDHVSQAWRNALESLVKLLPEEFFANITPPLPQDQKIWDDAMEFLQVDLESSQVIKDKMLTDKNYSQNLLGGMQFYFGSRLSKTILEQASELRDLQRQMLQKDEEIAKLRFAKKQKNTTSTPDTSLQTELEQHKQQIRQLEATQKTELQAKTTP
jgi:hypothetical protein